MDKDIISEARKYAKQNNVSLSLKVEKYLEKITNDYQDYPRPSDSIVDQLSGIIKLDKDADYKKIYADIVSEKYK